MNNKVLLYSTGNYIQYLAITYNGKESKIYTHTHTRTHIYTTEGLPRLLSSKESACQCRRHRFNSWVMKMPWRKKQQPTPVFLPGEFQDRGAWQATIHGVTKESDTT